MQKTALICGYGDLGKEVAKQMSEAGYQTIIMSRQARADSGYLFFQCDVTNPKQVAQTMGEISKSYKQIDVFVCAVTSEIKRKHVLDLSLTDLKEDFETTFFGIFNVLKEAARVMKEKKQGTIVVVTSAVTETSGNYGKMGGYISAKYALKGLVQQLAHELLMHNVTINAVAPGFMRTKLNKDIPERMDDFLKEKSPIKRLITPEDVAKVIIFLCSEKAKHLTGISLPVTGGETLSL